MINSGRVEEKKGKGESESGDLELQEARGYQKNGGKEKKSSR